MVQPDPKEAALRFRRTFGLDDSDEAMEYAKTFDQSSNRHGVPLNPEELADLDERSRQQEQQGPFADVAASLSGVLGGVWKDQRRRGEYVIMALRSLSATDLDRLVDALPSGARYRVEPATVSEATLRGWVDRLTRSLMLKTERNDLTADLEDMAVHVTSLAPEVQSNKVRVYLWPEPQDAARLEAAWERAAAAGEAPPRSFTTFDIRPPLQPL